MIKYFFQIITLMVWSFFNLTADDIKKIIPPIGLARKIMRLLPNNIVIEVHNKFYSVHDREVSTIIMNQGAMNKL